MPTPSILVIPGRVNNNWPAGLTKAEVSPSVCTPHSPSLFTQHQIIYSPSLNRFARCTLSNRKLNPAVWHHFKCYISFWYLQPTTAGTYSATYEAPNRPHSISTPPTAKLEHGVNSRKHPIHRHQRWSVVSFFVNKINQRDWILDLRVMAVWHRHRHRHCMLGNG